MFLTPSPPLVDNIERKISLWRALYRIANIVFGKGGICSVLSIILHVTILCEKYADTKTKSKIVLSANSCKSTVCILHNITNCWLRAGDIDLSPRPLNRSSDPQHQSHQRPNTISSSTASLCREMPSGLKIVHWNLNSIAAHHGNCKLDELRLLLSNPWKECHILGITETWLSRNFKNSEI